jgi:hypothetical protein
VRRLVAALVPCSYSTNKDCDKSQSSKALTGSPLWELNIFMAIFSRRTLQRLINENAGFLSKQQLRKHVDALNKANEHSLGAEWEIVLLNVFSKLGTVTHEPKLGTRPDLHFVSNADKSQEFIADIATVSDRGVDDRSPILALRIRLSDIIYKRGLKNSAFSLKVGSEVDNKVWPRPNPRLKIPHRSNLDRDVFNKQFFQFIEAVSLAPEKQHTHFITSTTPSVEIRITYDPSQERASVSPVYKELTSLVQNTVYSRLERKAGQLAKANYNGHRAIIICDGGCYHLNSKRYFYGTDVDDVVRYFLREHLGISFVLTLVVEQAFGSEAQRKLNGTLYPGEAFAQVGSEIREAIEKMGRFFPEAERSASNAVHLLEGAKTHEGMTFRGGHGVSDNEIRISARGLLELLSGRITQEQFFRAHPWMSISNPFDSQLSRGRLITEIGIEKGGEERDDDWLTMTFGQPDPAVSPFKVPSQ